MGSGGSIAMAMQLIANPSMLSCGGGPGGEGWGADGDSGGICDTGWRLEGTGSGEVSGLSVGVSGSDSGSGSGGGSGGNGLLVFEGEGAPGTGGQGGEVGVGGEGVSLEELELELQGVGTISRLLPGEDSVEGGGFLRSCWRRWPERRGSVN